MQCTESKQPPDSVVDYYSGIFKGSKEDTLLWVYAKIDTRPLLNKNMSKASTSRDDAHHR